MHSRIFALLSLTLSLLSYASEANECIPITCTFTCAGTSADFTVKHVKSSQIENPESNFSDTIQRCISLSPRQESAPFWTAECSDGANDAITAIATAGPYPEVFNEYEVGLCKYDRLMSDVQVTDPNLIWAGWGGEIAHCLSWPVTNPNACQ